MKQLLFIFLLIPAMLLHAQTKTNNQKPVRFLLGAAFEFGGDNLAEVFLLMGVYKK